MDGPLLLAAVFAGAIVVLTPGPAVLALFGIGAAQGRRAGAGFILGHLAGDLMWAALALVALVGAHVLAPAVFEVLAVVCGSYLLYLGIQSLTARRTAPGEVAVVARRPLYRGLIFGLTNPKSYPVTLSVFTALLASNLATITLANAPLLLVSLLLGFLIADAILIWVVGVGAVRRLYRAQEVWIKRATGLMFIGFAVSTLWQVWRG